MIQCRRMTQESLPDAFRLLSTFLSQDDYYLDSSHAYGDGGAAALGAALELFLHRPELGFVWLAYEAGEPVAVCVISLAISTSVGALVAKLDDVYVSRDATGAGHRVGAPEPAESRASPVGCATHRHERSSTKRESTSIL